ncbi:MAG TPA: ComEA family DNA-binding protein [Allocoleopsis sp.]
MQFVNWLKQQGQGLRSPVLNDPYYRFRSIAEVQQAANLGVRIDVNQATVDDWLRLPGLSIHQARLLVDLVRSGVPLYGLEDIAAVLNLPVQRLRPLEPILQFCYYDANPQIAPQPLNPNLATIEQLTQIPAVDLDLARVIVHHRQQGNYRNLVDLQQRLALPAQVTAALLHYFKF